MIADVPEHPVKRGRNRARIGVHRVYLARQYLRHFGVRPKFRSAAPTP